MYVGKRLEFSSFVSIEHQGTAQPIVDTFDGMSFLTLHDLETLRPDFDRAVEKVIGNTHTDVRNTIEKCLCSGYDRKRAVEKLGSLIDNKKANRLYDKLEALLEQYKVISKVKKRSHEDEDDDRASNKKQKQLEPMAPPQSQSVTAKLPPPVSASPAANIAQAIATSLMPVPAATDAADAGDAGDLTKQQIKVMMANAQREIEERKKALNALKEPSNQDDMERTRKIAELQAKIRAKLSGTLSLIIPPVQEKPKPLILDEQGRTVDNTGRAISIPTLAPTLKANIRAKKKETFNKMSQPNDRMQDDENAAFFDERIAAKSALRTKRALRFHEPGKFQQMAEKMRMKAQLEKLQNEISQIARKTGISSATKLALIAPKQDSHADDVPLMEWWDSVILTNDLKTMDGDKIAIRESAITNLIEHPTQMKPPSEFTHLRRSTKRSTYIHPLLFFFNRRTHQAGVSARVSDEKRTKEVATTESTRSVEGGTGENSPGTGTAARTKTENIEFDASSWYRSSARSHENRSARPRTNGQATESARRRQQCTKADGRTEAREENPQSKRRYIVWRVRERVSHTGTARFPK